MVGFSRERAHHACPRWCLIALVVVAAGGVYGNSLHNPFVYDDHRLILGNPSLGALPNVAAVVMHEMSRPLVNLTYALDYGLWTFDPFGYHLTNVLLHMLNVGLVFALTERLVRPRPTALIAFTTAAIFALNPMMTQAVGYVSGRAEVLCAPFVLLTMLLAHRFIASGQSRWLVGLWMAWLPALASKEVGIAVPVIVLAYDRLVQPESPLSPAARLRRLHAPLWGAMVAAALWRLWLLRTVEYPRDQFDPTYILVQLEAIRRYAVLLLGQGPQSIFHEVAPFNSLVSARALLAFATAPALALGIWWVARVNRLAAFGLVWFIACLLPASTLFVLGRGEAMAEHRVYVASIGFFLTAGLLVSRVSAVLSTQPARTRRLGAVVGMVLLAQLGLHTVLRNAVWADPLMLWSDAVTRAPRHWLPHLMKGEALRDQGRCAEAVPEYRTAIAGNPSEAAAYHQLGECLIALNALSDARATFERLEHIHPHSAEAAAGLGLVALADARLDEAHRLLQESARRQDRPAVRHLLAALETRTDPDSAAALCRQVRALAPLSKTAASCDRAVDAARP